MTTGSSEALKEKVKEFWEVQACGTNYASAVAESVAWFNEIEESRYAREPWIHSFAQFTRWQGKKCWKLAVERVPILFSLLALVLIYMVLI